MENVRKNRIRFPVGYHRFHKKQLFNFQLNRWHSLGYLPYEAMQAVGPRISDFATWKKEMILLAKSALTERRLVEAAFYFRAAEFYTMPGDPKKEPLYDRFSEMFYKAFQRERIEKHQIPYADAFLHAIRIPPAPNRETKGTIVLHGGFDSFMEEFYSLMAWFSAQDFEVIGFDGPGQGLARRKYGIAFDYRWEKPVKSVLDHFEKDDVTLFGLSMGGWLCLRAAAFEKRVKRVAASGHAYDYFRIPPRIAQWLMTFFNTKMKNFSNKISLKNIEKGGMEGWQMSQLMYITKIDTPMSAFDYAMEMNEKNLHADLIDQDVLLLTARSDHFIPYKLHDRQLELLANARSLTDRVFTKEESAHNHCQIGNMELLLETVAAWIEEK